MPQKSDVLIERAVEMAHAPPKARSPTLRSRFDESDAERGWARL
jgi:hypothetical protein